VGAAGVLAGIGVFDFIGTILSGWLSDRYDNRWLLFWYYGLRGLSLLYLPFTDFSFYGLSFFAVFYGLDWVATVPPTVRLAADRFGAERANLTFGWIFAGHQLGAATAAYGAGLTRDSFASYLPALYVAGTFCLLASLLVLSLSRPQQKPLAAAVAQPKGKPTDAVLTDDQFATGLRTAAATQAKALGTLGSLSQTHTPKLDDAISFRLADGGAVTFAMMQRTDAFTPKKGAKELVLPAEYAKLVGTPKVTKSLVLNNLEPVVIVQPKTGQAKVIGASDLLVSGRAR